MQLAMGKFTRILAAVDGHGRRRTLAGELLGHYRVPEFLGVKVLSYLQESSVFPENYG